MTTRIYLVCPPGHDAAGNQLPPRLVRATNAAAALRHVASEFVVALPTQDELLAARDEGVQVEDAR